MKAYNSNITVTFKKDFEAHITPIHPSVKSWLFVGKLNKEAFYDENVSPFDSEYQIVENEANLADAMARVAEDNGIEINQFRHIFTCTLRMLKSNSEWSK